MGKFRRTNKNNINKIIDSRIKSHQAKNVEMKYQHNTLQLDSTDPTSDTPRVTAGGWALNLFDNVHNGDDQGQRDGNRINAHSFQLKSTIYNVVPVLDNARIRVIIAETRQPLNVMSGQNYYDPEELFLPSSSTNDFVTVNRMFDTDFVKRIFYDKMINLQPKFNVQIPVLDETNDVVEYSTKQNMSRILNIYLKLKGKKVYFDGPSTTSTPVGDEVKTFLYLCFVSDVSEVDALRAPQIFGTWKLRFTDS